MKAVARIVILACLIFECLAPAATVTLAVEELGADLFRLDYQITDHQFLTNQELAIDFDPALFLSLANPVAPPGFDVILFQPDNPPGAFGRLSALALVDFVSLSQSFSVEVRSAVPDGRQQILSGMQSFSINQLDEDGILISTIAEGRVIASPVPEPHTAQLSAIGLLVACVCPVLLRRLKTSS